MENKEYLIINLIEQLHSVHKQINTIIFDGQLEDVNITINGLAKRRTGCSVTLGIYSHLVDTSNGQLFSNNKQLITINNYALCGQAEEIIAVLVHEMCHQMNHQLKINDTNGKRHNAFFRDMAIKAKLNVEKDSWQGYSATSLSEELSTIIKQLDINLDVFKSIVYYDNYLKIANNIVEEKRLKIEKQKVAREKIVDYYCNNCKYQFRLKQEIDIKCNTCDQTLTIDKPYQES